MTRILFLINSLGGGGAERVLVNLVNRMDYSKYEITVETMFDDGNYRDLLRPEIKYFCKHAPCPPGISRLFRLIPSPVLYQYFIGDLQYDILIAYLHGAPVKVISGCADRRVKKISWLHYGNPNQGTFFNWWLNEKIAIQAYDSMDAIVGVAQSVTTSFEAYTGIHGKLYTVYNTNDVDRITEMSQQKCITPIDRGVEICAAGRLVPQKGFDRLINVAKKLHDEGYKFHISIMGTGKASYQNYLRKKITKAKADTFIELLGYQNNPYSIIALSDLFVLSSREEGLATVLTEALLCGTPIIATDVSGTKEVLGENSEYGLIVHNSEDGIYEGLKRILDAPELLNHYKEMAKTRASHFAPEKTVSQAESIIELVLNR